MNLYLQEFNKFNDSATKTWKQIKLHKKPSKPTSKLWYYAVRFFNPPLYQFDCRASKKQSTDPHRPLMGAGGKRDEARYDHGCGTTICHVFTNLEPWALQQWHTFAMDPKYFHVLPHRLTSRVMHFNRSDVSKCSWCLRQGSEKQSWLANCSVARVVSNDFRNANWSGPLSVHTHQTCK